MDLNFKVRGGSPTNRQPAWRQFLAANGGVILTWTIVILCIIAAMRMGSPDEESSSASKEKIFSGDPHEVLAPMGSERTEPVSPGGSSLDTAPKWGSLTPASDEDGGPIEMPTAKNEPPAPPPSAPPPAAGAGMGINLPIDASKMAQGVVAEEKKRLPKPTGAQAAAGGGGATSGMGQFVSFQERENRERDAQAGEPKGGLGAGSASTAAGIKNAGPVSRDKQTLIRSGIGGSAGMEKLAVEKDILYKIDDMVKKASERSLETGAPTQITDAEAQALIREIGVKMGTADKKTSPSSQ